MSDLKLFRLQGGKAEEVKGSASDLEKPLQNLIENNLEALLGVRFLATEYPTGKTHGGRIDTLGLDENACPVILEYKRSLNENVINQGLYYLDWLMDHKAEFWKLAVESLTKEVADAIDWSGPRLICIAGDFTKYDEHAVQQINRNIELIRYRRFGDDHLLLEGVNSVSASGAVTKSTGTKPPTGAPTPKGNWEQEWETWWPQAPQSKQLYDAVYEFMLTLGDDVQIKFLKQYIAFKRLRNYASVVALKQPQKLLLNVHLNPDTVEVEPSWMRDVRQIGIWGTGQLELTIQNLDDLEKAKPLIRRAYDGG